MLQGHRTFMQILLWSPLRESLTYCFPRVLCRVKPTQWENGSSMNFDSFVLPSFEKKEQSWGNGPSSSVVNSARYRCLHHSG